MLPLGSVAGFGCLAVPHLYFRDFVRALRLKFELYGVLALAAPLPVSRCDIFHLFLFIRVLHLGSSHSRHTLRQIVICDIGLYK